MRTTGGGGARPRIVLVALVLLLASCPQEQDPPPPDETPTATSTPDATPDVDATLPADPYAAARAAVTASGPDGLARAVAADLAATGEVSGDVDEDAARLRASLTTNLRSHAHLVAHVAEADRLYGSGSAWEGAATDALAATVRELTDIVAGVAGSSAGAALHDAWSDLTRSLLDPDGDPDASRERVADVLADITDGEMSGEESEVLLDDQTQLIGEAVAAASDGDEAAFAAAREASAAAARTASRFAEALTAAHEVEGDPESEVAAVHTTLAGALVDDIHLTVRTAVVIHHHGVDDPRFISVTDALDASAVRVAETFDGVSEVLRTDVLAGWRSGIGAVVDLSRAHAAGDERLAEAAEDELRAEAEAVAEVLAAGLDGPTSAEELRELLDERARALAQMVRGARTDRGDGARSDGPAP